MAKIKEMTAAGSGATIGPIQPLGAEKEKVEEMLRRNPDLKPGHVVVFNQGAHYFLREDFRNSSRVEDYDGMANLVREEVARQTVRQRMDEVVRKKDGKYVLYAPNTGKKHSPKPVGVFHSKLAAKRAELAKFPPKDPKKLERLRKQVEKLMTDPKARARAELQKESYDRDLVERAFVSSAVNYDVRRQLLGERLFREEEQPDEYDTFIKSLSDRAVKGDKGYQRRQKNYDKQAEVAMLKKLRGIQKELGMRVKPGAAKKHTDGKMYLPFAILTDAPVKPIYLYVDGTKINVEISDEANAALTKCTPEVADKIRSRLSSLSEEAATGDEFPELSQARGSMTQYVKSITKFLDDFMAKLSPVAMTVLKKLWAKKYRKLGASS